MINVGRSLGNLELLTDKLSFVDIFFVLEPPAYRNEEKQECEKAGFELFSLCKRSRIEVFVKRDIVGLVSFVKLDMWSVVIGYETEGGEKKMFGGIYLSPGEKKKDTIDKLNTMNKCDIFAGELNARNIRWGSNGVDEQTNTDGYAVNE